MGRRRISGSPIGGIAETQEMLNFCARHNILPDCEMIAMQDINEAFTIRVQATDNWFNAISGASDLIRITAPDDPRAFAIPAPGDTVPLPQDIQLVDGIAELKVWVRSGGLQRIFATNLTDPGMSESFTAFEVAE